MKCSPSSKPPPGWAITAYSASPGPTWESQGDDGGYKEQAAMTAKTDPKWRRFERLVEQIQRTLTPDAYIRFDEKIMGNLSRTLRQFDVTVRQGDMLTVFDCKDYKKPIDVKDVEQFIPMVEDVGANHAVIVSAKGFSKGAINRGKAAGVGLFKVVDAEKHDWQTYMTIPVLEECWVVIQSRWKVTSFALDRLAVAGDLELYDVSMRPVGTLRDLLNRRIQEEGALREPGQHEDIDLFAGPTFAEAADGETVSNHVQADIQVREDLYLHQVPLTNIKGFEDVVSGGIHTRDFITDWIDANDMTGTTQKIPNRSMLPVRPMLIYTTSQITL